MTATLTIGDLAERTGVAVATLRMWETRHGFPDPERLPSGHRRYTDADVDVVRDVVRRRDAGVRLDVAVAQARATAAGAIRPASPSVFAELRRLQPHLAVQRLRKRTLLALSWAIEDEYVARAEPGHVFGAFQRTSRFDPARARWIEIAEVAAETFVFADFPEAGSADRLHRVPLPPQAPMLREWAVVCDAPGLPVALTAWELPGQVAVADRDRIFEAVWTLEPAAVRDASRTCSRVALSCGVEAAEAALAALDDEPAPIAPDPRGATDLFRRVLAYTDRSA